MKKVLLFLLMICMLGAGATFWGYTYYESAINNPFNKEEEIKVEVKNGDSLYILLDRLFQQEKIKNPLAFKLYMNRNDIQVVIKPGVYSLSGKENFLEFVNRISKGKQLDGIRVTIVEGMNIEQMAEVFENSGLFTSEDFLKAINEYEIPDYIQFQGEVKYKMEGFIYPDTYEFLPKTSPDETIRVMHEKQREIIDEIKQEYSVEVENYNEIITLASIVEKEAIVDEDRGKISSVYTNRLNIDMPLQSCPTVIYSIGNDFYKRKKLIVLNKDLEVESVFNTYKNKGLPPGPIGAPRKESIIAALVPDETDYLYFIAQNDGSHFFTRDYNEFLRIKMKNNR